MPKPFVTTPPPWTRDQVAAYIYAAYEVLPKMVRGGASQTAAKKSLEYILKVWQLLPLVLPLLRLPPLLHRRLHT
eukprot:2939960-Pyramimonas_sp.AAC.1